MIMNNARATNVGCVATSAKVVRTFHPRKMRGVKVGIPLLPRKSEANAFSQT